MRFKKKLIIKGKIIVAKIVLFFLYRAFRVLLNKDTNIKNEIDKWEEGQTIEIKTGFNTPILVIQKTNRKITKKERRNKKSQSFNRI